MRASALFCLAALCSPSASAQTNALFFNFPNGNVYDGSTPVKVEVWASFEPQYFAWATWTGAVNGDVSGKFSSPALANPVPPPGTSPGTPGNGGVSGILSAQLYLGFWYPDTSNPIHIWSGEWSTNDLNPRTLALSTSTATFYVYFQNQAIEYVVPTEASGLIQVVPAPATLLSTLALVCIGRRKR